MKKKIQAGDVFPINTGGSVSVIKYISSKKIIIQHNDENNHQAVVDMSALTKGKIKNPFMPSVSGVGFNGVGRHKKWKDGKDTLVYSRWAGMLKRCYCESYLKNKPSYAGCTVAPEWHNFQNFAEWFEENYKEGMHLDKDLTIIGNKVYSPEACYFVPIEINSLLTNCKDQKNGLPIGASRHATRYRAQITINNKLVLIGSYKTAAEASLAYIEEKEKNIKIMAEKHKENITAAVFNNLMKYKVIA